MYYTDEKNTQILISLLKAHSLANVILSPGATNIPLSGSLSNDDFFKLYSSVDERSSAYMACGMSEELEMPVVISCTGATASRNYLPAITEAFYRKLPILVVAYIPGIDKVGNLYPQVIDREVSPKDTYKAKYNIPIVKNKNDEITVSRLINQAIIELFTNGGGPVLLNIETSYLGTFNTKELPNVDVVHYYDRYSKDLPEIKDGMKVIIWVGEHKKFDTKTLNAIESFSNCYDTVVMCDHTSSYYGEKRLLSSLTVAQLNRKMLFELNLNPDVIIHIGGISGDYFTSKILSGIAPVWRVGQDNKAIDRLNKLTNYFCMDEFSFFQNYMNSRETHKPNLINSKYFKRWVEYDRLIRTNIPDIPFSNIWIAKEMSQIIPQNSILHFGILNSLRSWNFFEVDGTINTKSNVGGFGIDGCLSTLVGASLCDNNKLSFIVLGDLAFFYDINVIGNRHIDKNIRILLVNNGAGAEFNMYSHIGSQFKERTNDYIAAGGHFGNKSVNAVRGFSESLGFKYISARNKEEFNSQYETFISFSNHPILFECFTNLEDESLALKMISEIDKRQFKESALQKISSFVPISIKKQIRKVLR